MSVEVLVATIDQKDYKLFEKMKIKSDAIIGNQCEKNEIKVINTGEFVIKYLSFSERGVGLNRNNALMRASSEYCLFADDDEVLIDNYATIIEKSFIKYPKADIIIFNIDDNHIRYKIKKKMNIHYLNFMRFGAVRIAFRRKKIAKNTIYFNQFFGGGTKYGSGEDTLFLKSCLKNNLKIIGLPIEIAKLKDVRKSTWFSGYNAKYFKDKGALFAAISKRYFMFLTFQFLIRHRNQYKNKYSFFEVYRYMIKGKREYYNE